MNGCQGRGQTVSECGMDRNIQLYLKWITNQDLLCSSGTLLKVMWQAGREGNLRENGYMDMYHLKPSQHCLLTRYTSKHSKKSLKKKNNKKLYTETAVRLFMGNVYYSSMAKVLHVIKETLRFQRNLYVCSKITEETSFTHTAQSTTLNEFF